MLPIALPMLLATCGHFSGGVHDEPGHLDATVAAIESNARHAPGSGAPEDCAHRSGDGVEMLHRSIDDEPLLEIGKPASGERVDEIVVAALETEPGTLEYDSEIQSVERAGMIEPDVPPGDTVYGAQTAGGTCPSLPNAFPKIHRVSSFREFVGAYERVQPGEAVVIANGSHDWTSFVQGAGSQSVARPLVLGRSGTAEKPIYIVSETLHTALFEGNAFTFVLRGDHHVVAGMHFRNARAKSFYVEGADNRIACNLMENGNDNIAVAHQGADRTEIDNNVIVGARKYAMMLLRCIPTRSFCTENSKYHHIHHNTWRDKRFENENGHEAIILGLGYAPAPGKRIYNDDGPEGTNMHALIENNLFDRWNGESELISVKSGGNVIRNNCIMNSPAAGIKIRIGYDNLITGNWFENSNHGGQEISGKRNYIVFNYYSHSARSIRLAHGEQYTASFGNGNYKDLLRYVSADANVISHNVFGRTQYMVSVYPRFGSPSVHRGSPRDNILNANLYLTARLVGADERGSYRSGDNRYPEAAFREYNDWRYNEVIDKPPASSRCGDPTVFDGIGGPGAMVPGGPLLYGAPQQIEAPSWW